MRPIYFWIVLASIAVSLGSVRAVGGESESRARIEDIVKTAARNVAVGLSGHEQNASLSVYVSAFLYEWAENKNSELADRYFKQLRQEEEREEVGFEERYRNGRILTHAMMEIHALHSKEWPLWGCAVAVVGVVNVALAAAIGAQ